MNFAWALDQMMQGKKVKRKCWGNSQRISVKGEGPTLDFVAECDWRDGLSVSPNFTLNANSAYAYDWELFEEDDQQ